MTQNKITELEIRKIIEDLEDYVKCLTDGEYGIEEPQKAQTEADVLALILKEREEGREEGYKNVRSWFDNFNYPYLTADSKGCGVCGGKLTKIRGRFPHEPRRKTCPTCSMEILESIVDNLNSLTEGAKQDNTKLNQMKERTTKTIAVGPSTNAHAAIQAAVNAGSALGGAVVHIQAGTYNLDRPNSKLNQMKEKKNG